MTMNSCENFVKLSNGGLMHKVGLGTWKAPRNVSKEVVYEAIKCGYKHIDCASIYANEQEVGEALTQAFNENICRREDIFVTSKVWNTYHKYENVILACRRTLDDLQLKYLDLYLIHFPVSLKFIPFEKMYPTAWTNPNTNRVELDNVSIKETWEAMEELVKMGLVKAIGVSNFNVQLLTDLLSYAKIKPVVNQVELHPYLTQENLIKFCENNQISVTAYSPFGGISYATFGTWDESMPQPLKDPVIESIAKKHNKSTAQIILRWSVQRANNITVLVKTANKDRLSENLDTLSFQLPDEDIKAISSLNKNIRYNDPVKFCHSIYNSFVPVFD